MNFHIVAVAAFYNIAVEKGYSEELFLVIVAALPKPFPEICHRSFKRFVILSVMISAIPYSVLLLLVNSSCVTKKHPIAKTRSTH